MTLRVRMAYATTAILSAILALRAVHGVIVTPWFRVASPIPLEAVIVLALFVSYVSCRSCETGSVPDLRIDTRYSYVLLGFGMLLVAVVFVPNLTTPFLSDDYILIRTDLPTFSQFTAWFRIYHSGDGAFRPLGSLYFGVMHRLAGFDAFGWHCAGLGLHLLNSLLIWCIVRELWRDSGMAVLSAILFGIHGTRAETVSWVAASFDLLATFCVLSSLFVFFRGSRRWLTWLVALLLLVAGVLFKESAYAYPLLLLALAVAADRLRRSVLVFAGLAFIICGALIVHRWMLFNGPGGYIDSQTGRSLILSLHFLSTAKALLSRIWVILVFPINWDAGMNSVMAAAIWLGCIGLLSAFIVARRLKLVTTAGLLGSVIFAVLPAVHVSLIGDDALGGRILYLPSLGLIVFISMALTVASRPDGRIMKVARSTVVILYFGISIMHNLQTWRSNARRADVWCTEAAQNLYNLPQPPSKLNGVYFFQNGFAQCMEMKRETMASGKSMSIVYGERRGTDSQRRNLRIK
jgi:hypothetical protein